MAAGKIAGVDPMPSSAADAMNDAIDAKAAFYGIWLLRFQIGLHGWRSDAEMLLPQPLSTMTACTKLAADFV